MPFSNRFSLSSYLLYVVPSIFQNSPTLLKSPIFVPTHSPLRSKHSPLGLGKNSLSSVFEAFIRAPESLYDRARVPKGNMLFHCILFVTDHFPLNINFISILVPFCKRKWLELIHKVERSVHMTFAARFLFDNITYLITSLWHRKENSHYAALLSSIIEKQ